MHFDLSSIRTVEFGVGRDDGDEHAFHCVMVDDGVQTALSEMMSATWDAMQKLTNEPVRYEPSEKHSGCEHVYLPLEDRLADRMRNLHEAANLDIDQNALDDSDAIFCYFARFTDGQGRHLTALRRAIQFKGVLKSRLIQFGADALKMVEDKVFKLDNDFDLLIDNQRVHILRPSGFEFAGKLQDAILGAVADNVAILGADLPFVQFDGIQQYASTHPRAARYLASIRSQQEVDRIDRQHLIEACGSTGVEITEDGEQIVVDERNIMGFLEVLDRRRYEVRLVPEEPEQYRAPSRTRLR
ncbi:MAG: Kiwa anti-phage protein KwaB-like domain-containing protein [Candidatus Thiodiazotropha sp.]